MSGLCRAHRWSGIVAAGLLLIGGCNMTPEQQLIGRWYNSAMTIRFRQDGGVIMNTPAGRAIGRYYYISDIRRTAADVPRENLVLDVVRNEERIRLGFEVEVIAGNRLRLYDLTNNPRVSNRAGRMYDNVVLKRADENDGQLTM